MAFSKNWKQLIVSKGEPFQIEYLDRKFNGRSRVVFKINDDTGAVEVNGVELTGTQNIAGAVVATGNVTSAGTVQGATVHSTGATTVGTTLAVTGASTFTGQAKLPASSFHSFCVQGTNSSVTPSHITATGVKVGDKVIMVADTTNHLSRVASFEATVTVNDQIQQSATDLSAATLVVLVLAQS